MNFSSVGTLLSQYLPEGTNLPVNRTG